METPANKSVSNSMGKKLTRLQTEYSIIMAFLVIAVLASLANSEFLTSSNIINILRQVSIIGIISLGMTLIIISGGIDLSVGAVLALVGALALTVLNFTQSITATLVAALMAGAFIGVINGLLITKGKITPFIVTLGVMASTRSLVLYYAKGGSIVSKVNEYTVIASGEIGGISYPVFIFLACAVLMYILSQKTPFGRYVYAIGSNEKAALLSAINVNMVKTGIYMLGGMLTALAAVIESSRLNSMSSASSGINYELDAIAAVIIGGTRMSGGKGTIIGTFFGVLILGILNNTLNLMNISPYLQGMVKGLIIITAVLLQKKE
ncbi:ABC transporter permease [Sporomusa sp.]|uniref:ABC transporter permease n=1 Tax=Sporomusa sp. TaxID=2078658 RepID=UPI002CF96552|nr:ABC transporter permease [Sporomusa sp.]HWR43785.1 ABC transporter permease [Sporomusa sp.]